MESTNISIERVAVKYGFITASGLAIYFLIMKLVGLVHIIELRSLNLFIMVAGLWYAMKYYRDNSTSHLNYFEGICLGTLTAALAVIPFSIFVFFYMIFDTAFMETIRANEDFGEYLNPYLLSFIITFEGFISGVMVSFVLMQYLKKKYIGSAE